MRIRASAWAGSCPSALTDRQLALDALEMAFATRDVSPGLIHHSDRGMQYASTAYVDRLTQVGACVSMSSVGNPYDNAKAERFFKTLKQEEVYLNNYPTLQEAQANIHHYIEEVNNTKRLHSRLGYVPPAEFEMAYTQGLRCCLVRGVLLWGQSTYKLYLSPNEGLAYYLAF
jgi:putative transposase